MRQAFAIASKCVDQPAERRLNYPFVRQTVEHRTLTASSTGAAFRHVGCLVPVQHIGRRIQITDLAQSLLEFDQICSAERRLRAGLPAILRTRAADLGLCFTGRDS